jgi:hypothetical protein
MPLSLKEKSMAIEYTVSSGENVMTLNNFDQLCCRVMQQEVSDTTNSLLYQLAISLIFQVDNVVNSETLKTCEVGPEANKLALNTLFDTYGIEIHIRR